MSYLIYMKDTPIQDWFMDPFNAGICLGVLLIVLVIVGSFSE